MLRARSGTGCLARCRVEPRSRPLDADDPRELARGCPAPAQRSRRDPPRAPPGRRRSPRPNALELLDERSRVVIVRDVYAVSGSGGQLHVAEREHHLARRRRVADARPAELRDALHDGRAVREVDRDRVVLARGRQRRRLAGLAHERLQVRPRELAQVEPLEHGVAELDEPQREAVAAVLRHVLDEARRGERREEARDGARVDAGAARDLVRPELTAVGERVEHGEARARRRRRDGRLVDRCGRDGTLLLSLDCRHTIASGGNST